MPRPDEAGPGESAQRVRGSGSAGEVFRVFASRHPGIRIVAENANLALEHMFRHVGRG